MTGSKTSPHLSEKDMKKLRKEIELGWDGLDSSMTMDQIIEPKKKL